MNTESREYKAAKQLEDAINDMCWNPIEFALATTTYHRTLQQSLFRTIVEIIKAFAENKNIDLRNRAAHEAAKRLMEVVVCLDPLPMV